MVLKFLCPTDLLVKKIGAERVTSVVLGLHVLRLSLVLCVGLYGTVWHTVLVELLNGPCYGFGYTAIVVHAGQLAPAGASTTVQSLANICYESIGIYKLLSINFEHLKYVLPSFILHVNS